MMNWKGYENKLSWPIQKCLEGLRKPQNPQSSYPASRPRIETGAIKIENEIYFSNAFSTTLHPTSVHLPQIKLIRQQLVPQGARSKAHVILDRSNTGIVGSMAARCMAKCPRLSVLSCAV
jgi:hypothetical protein